MFSYSAEDGTPAVKLKNHIDEKIKYSYSDIEDIIAARKIDKEYTSQRTKDAQDGNDWKALSHALRILFEIEELSMKVNCKASKLSIII